MKKILKRLILWYFIFVIIKSILSYFVPAPSEFSDGYIYAKMARNMFYFLTPNIGSGYQPLYPIILSISYFFRDMTIVYPIMKFINSLISSLIIFPAWFIAKEFFDKKDALKLAILVSLISPIFAFAPLIMSENLYFPLFLLSSYFIYRSFVTPSYRWDILAGIFIGISIASRILSIALVAGLFGLLIFDYFHKDHSKQFKRKCVLFIFTFIFISPLIIENLLTFGFSFSGLLGRYSGDAGASLNEGYPFTRIIPRILINFGYTTIALLIIYVLSSLTLFKDYKSNYKLFTFGTLTFTTLFALLLISVNHGINSSAFLFDRLGGQVLGRYLAAIFPAFFIIGSYGFIKKHELSKKYLIITALILAFTANIVILPLFPINNMSLTYLGVVLFFLRKIISDYILLIIFGIIFFTLPFIFYKIYRKFNFEKITSWTFIFFILLGILNYSVIIFNSHTFWYKGDQMQLGIWFNDYDKGKSTVLFDIRDNGEKIEKLNQSILCDPNACIMGFWMNNNILIGHPDEVKSDYIISKHKLDYPIVKEQGGIYIYENKNNHPSV